MALQGAEVHSFNARPIRGSLCFDKDVLHETSVHQLLGISSGRAITFHRLTPLSFNAFDRSQGNGNSEGANRLITEDLADKTRQLILSLGKFSEATDNLQNMRKLSYSDLILELI